MNPVFSSRLLKWIAVGVCVLLVAACEQRDITRTNIRLLIGSKSTGGDTYRAASIVADALATELGVSVKVDAVGASAAFRALKRTGSGSTIMLFHDQAYLGEIYGQAGYEDIFSEYRVGPTVAINVGNGYLTRKSSRLDSVDEVIAAAGRGEIVRVAIQPGGVSEIGYSALKNAIRLAHPGMEGNLVAINTGSQSDKNQQLFDGQADVISGTVQANEQYTRLPPDDQKAMRFIWLTARSESVRAAPEQGLGQTTRDALLTYAEPAVRVPLGEGENFTFDKDFFLIYNRDTDQSVIRRIDAALRDIYARGDIQAEFRRSFLVPGFRDSVESADYLLKKQRRYAALIDTIGRAETAEGEPDAAIPGLRFEESHRYFPRIVSVLLGACVLGLLLRRRPWKPPAAAAIAANVRQAIGDMAAGPVLGTVALLCGYVLAMELLGEVYVNAGIGFLIASVPFLFALSLLFAGKAAARNRLAVVLVSVGAPLAAWLVFGQFFRITLP